MKYVCCTSHISQQSVDWNTKHLLSNTSMTHSNNNVSMRTYCVSLSLTHIHACMLETADGERNRLTFYREEKNGGGRYRKERKKKEKPGVILASKKKKVTESEEWFFFFRDAAQWGCMYASRHASEIWFRYVGIILWVVFFLGLWGKMRKIIVFKSSTGCTLLAQASSSHVVSCRTLMISLISALIFSKVNLRFLSASSTPAPRLLFVATKIFIAEERNNSIYVYTQVGRYIQLKMKCSFNLRIYCGK